MRSWLLLGLAGLAACNPEGSSPQPSEPHGTTAEPQPFAPPVTEPALPAPITLTGEWRVAGIDGADFNEAYGLALSANEREIWWEPRCAGFVRSYEIEGASIRLRLASGTPAPARSGATPPPVCAIGLPSRLSDVFAALDAADRVVRTPSNGIEISGGGRSVLLFSQ